MVDRHRRRRAASPRQHGRGAASGQALSTARSRPARKAPGRARARRPKGQGWRFPRSRATRRPQAHDPRDLRRLALAALGVVYGDIGTSPLYALAECFGAGDGVPLDAGQRARRAVADLLGADRSSSRVKYVVAHHARRQPRRGRHPRADARWRCAGAAGGTRRRRTLLIARAVRRGAALRRRRDHAGDLGALRGRGPGGRHAGARALRACRSTLGHPGRRCSLIQRHGTARVGALFGPVMLRLVRRPSRVLGRRRRSRRRPAILLALNPLLRRATSSRDHGWHGFLALGAVVLAVTGGEALYADMGHFGKRPIRLAWFGVVLPALVLNYFGQGALLLRDPERGRQPVLPAGPGLGCSTRWSCSRRWPR